MQRPGFRWPLAIAVHERMDRVLRDLVWRRANDRCEYCLLPQSLDAMTFEIDHIIAEKHRGQTTAENLALSCFPCNVHKGSNIGGLDPETALLMPLYHPRIQNWADHFAWDGAILNGRTAVGRTTIEVLKINHPGRVEHRRLLMQVGLLRFE